MRRTTFLVLLAACGFAPPLAAQPVPAKDAAGKMTVPAGFKVTLFAGEPDVVQPIAFTFDDRGRMWVVECVMYPKWSQDGKNGKDRVVILEDADGDGVHDKKTVVIDDGVNLSGIEVGFGGIYLCASPNLLFVPIKDDKPAGKPEVLLDGWNIKDTKHNIFNSLAWGPDGWLYGCNGIQTKSYVGRPSTPQDKRVFFDCGVWRFHPTKKVFEVFANGTTNPFGLDWDDNGELYITNCVIDHLFHFFPGGHYQRMYGQDPNPNINVAMRSCVDYKHWGGGAWTDSRADQKTGALKKEHDDAGGGHAHSGCAIYLGDNFPPAYRNTLFTSNIHGSRLNNDGLARTPGGVKGVRRPDFLFANDPWFRGICVKQGPDGGLYVSDWTDTGECHNYVVADTTNGRIYRTIYGDQKSWKGNVAAMTDAELVAAQGSKNEWLVRRARRVLQERATAGTLAKSATESLHAALASEADLPRKLRAIWALEAIGALTTTDLLTLCGDANPVVRSWAYRLAFVGDARAAEILTPVAKFAERENDPFALTYLASAIQRLKPALRADLGKKLLAKAEYAGESNRALMLWFGVEGWFAAKPDEAIRALPETAVPVVREQAVRLVLSQPKERAAVALDELMAVLAQAGDPAVQLDILRGIRDAFAGQKAVNPPKSWGASYIKLRNGKSPEVKRAAEAVGVLFNDITIITEIKKRALSTTEKPEDRRAALELLVPQKEPLFGPVLLGLLKDPAVRSVALRGLANYPDDATSAAILAHYAAFTAEEKADAIQTLTTRPKFALALLAAVEKGGVPKTDISAFTARQILALNDKAVSAKLNAAWGTVRPASQTRAEQTAKFKALLTPEALKSANVSNGQKVFAKSCVVCHKLFGEGGDVGPELTGSQRSSLDYVLENVLDPSAAVPNEYKMTTFNLADGRVLSGIIRRQTPQAVTIRTLNEEITVATADIESRKQTPLSIMPDGLFDALKDDEVRDLVAYLQSQK